jgi:hypothetical protein
MADVVPIPGAESTAKVRSPIWVTVLALVTLGIYAIFWWYFVHRELRDYGQARGTDELGTSPGKSVLAITLGALIIVPAIIGYINGFKRVQAAQRLNAINPINGWIGLLLFIVFYPAFYGYMQSGLSAAWRTAAAPGQAAPEPTA